METIKNLIKKILEETDSKALYKLAIRLREYGSKAVDPVLAELFALKTKERPQLNSQSVFYLVDVVSIFAEPGQARQLAELLLWDHIALSDDRSDHHVILRALERIGDKSIIHLLRDYSKKLQEEKEYHDRDGTDPMTNKPWHVSVDYCRQADQQNIELTIKLCQERG